MKWTLQILGPHPPWSTGGDAGLQQTVRPLLSCSRWPGCPGTWDPMPQGSSLCSWLCRKTLPSLLLSQPLFGHLSSTACLRTAWCSYHIHRWCHM